MAGEFRGLADGGGNIVRVRIHPTIGEVKKELIKRYVSLRKVLGEDISDGEIIEEALDVYDLEKRCEEQMKKVQEFFKKRA